MARRNAKSARKRTLIAKFERLEKRKESQQPWGGRSNVFKVTQPSAERVSVLDDIEVSPTAIGILAKGPKYVVSPSWSRQELQHTVQVEIAALAYSLRWQSAMEAQPGLNLAASGTNTNNTTLSKTCPFTTGRKEPPRKNYATEKEIQGLQMDMQNLVDKCKLSFTPNITIQERKAIADLRTKDDTIITRSDKGGELVVMKESRLKELCLAHLSDKKTYKRLKKDPTNDIRLLVNRTLQEVLSRSEVPESVIDRLITNPSAARTQRFYALPKTHKEQLKIRPIVSACGGIFDRLGWFLQVLLKPLLKNVSAHLNSTAQLVERLENTTADHLKGMIPVSFDVVSLYTNVDTEEAIKTTLEYVIKYKPHCFGLNTGDI